MRSSSRTDYLRRIDRVIALVSASIDAGEELPSIPQLAREAHLSEFHFMRVYRALAGEALGATIQRLRLQRAVHLLKQTSLTITDVAAGVGYETPQAFAKAFRQKFGAAPTDVRERPSAYLGQLAGPAPATREPPVIRVEVIELQPFRAAALRNHGAYGDLDRAYVRLFGWMAEQGLLESVRGIWGAPHHDRRDTPPEQCVFDCCLETDAPFIEQGAVRQVQLGGGRYAVYRHVGSYALLDDAHDALLRDALPAGGLSLREAPILHRFLNEPDDTPEAALETEIFVPVERGERSCSS